jgi:hypothetical protein
MKDIEIAIPSQIQEHFIHSMVSLLFTKMHKIFTNFCHNRLDNDGMSICVQILSKVQNCAKYKNLSNTIFYLIIICLPAIDISWSL